MVPALRKFRFSREGESFLSILKAESTEKQGPLKRLGVGTVTVVIVGQKPENPRVLGAGADDKDHRENPGS